MHTLFLNLASHQGILSCVTDEQVVASTPVDHRIDDAQLVPCVENALLSAGWAYSDLTNIACVVGPGGFTSLRVAVALANALSHELGIPSCGVHLSEVYQARTPPPPTPPPHLSASRIGEGEGRVWLHSTKKSELFIRESSDSGARCITVDELRNTLHPGLQWMGELIPEHRKIISEAGAEEALLRPLEDVLPAFLRGREYRMQILTPWYGRGW